MMGGGGGSGSPFPGGPRSPQQVQEEEPGDDQ
jgi:hypothetical protein